ncbi:hypothetical protein C5E45_06040 [Nocardia nova]|uniref:Mce-associated membrane protein n=1 Tax=Nocardia nova TaxID=37330 RepID=A0A2S6AUU4_9NOCA|nr:hypothetical protein [Nocardia nova]PPJ32437.1 hypothetical protein C5E41_04685 [Nocardia nova]PPJ39052.1 hypothetical protein C5E45_06040 [Nocardia nova]
MSDDDTAKDKANNDAESTEKVDAAQDSTAADATVKFESDSSAAAAKGADAAKAADADRTVKLETAGPTSAEAATTKVPTPVAAPASASSPGTSTPWVPIVAAFAAGVLLVAAITAVVVFYLKADNREDQLAARDDSTKAACDFGKAVASYDADHLDDYFKQVADVSTGEWGKFWSGASGTLKDAMVSVHAKSKLDEIHCAWESGNDSEANVVLVITQEQSNQAVPQPDKLTIPGVAHMEKHDGKWLISKFDSPVTKGMGPSGPAPGAPQAVPGTSPQANGGPQPAPAPPPGN